MATSSDPAWKASNELRLIGEALMRIARVLHEHTRKLEMAVEGTYAGEGSDPRVRLLSASLRVSRVFTAKRVIFRSAKSASAAAKAC